ncbi:helix-turn-helix domain-containing protein [Streptomyces eurocidicus]|uniref:Transcriptional regulator with XRE-family HTH domain n=1 Tax=Streptomyces eurocidicus TaxID=66423 RepID=A0A7W8BAH8_STREU|nr:helix-turn-helix transcriptional regulator [Streptomyces eurocidicus]MBB5119812.1 transcriptional regulator with XRE-family HTH domain [Streptomyces eurocidicus]MBF6050831.1 helix-turn-helix domain-containing protein [Streptomyces eurocidicus]
MDVVGNRIGNDIGKAPGGGGQAGPLDGVGDTRRALGGFLHARRARVAPEHVGLAGGGRRRVRGLRREELAQLAGISVDYYVRLEQGRATQPSHEVLDALARALGLDAAEREHLATLAAPRRGAAPGAGVSRPLRRVLDSLGPLPAFVTDHRLDVVAWNGLGAELIGGLADPDGRDRNQARFLFLDPASRAVHPDWAERATEAVGQLRVSAGRYPDDAELAALIMDLSTRSDEFRRIWVSGEVLMCGAGRKRLRHPAAGLLTLDFEALHVPAGPGELGLVVHVFSAEEGSEGAVGLTRLAEAVREREREKAEKAGPVDVPALS